MNLLQGDMFRSKTNAGEAGCARCILPLKFQSKQSVHWAVLVIIILIDAGNLIVQEKLGCHTFCLFASYSGAYACIHRHIEGLDKNSWSSVHAFPG